MRKLLTGFLYIVIWAFTLPPLRLLYAGSRLAYLVMFYFPGYRKKVVFRNIRTSFPGLPEKDVILMAGKYYMHLSEVMAESLKALHWPVNRLKKRISLNNPDYLQELAKEGKNIVVLAGHTGNWEWLPALITPYGFDLLGVYKPQTSKVFNELTIKIRKKEGVLPISMRETARAIKEAGREGKPKALLLIADQIPARPDIHFWEKFLNQDTAWFTGGEKIASRYNIPVVYAKVIKNRRGVYEGSIIPISPDPQNEPEGEITRRYIFELENNILAQPVNWLWSHRRWKHHREDISL